jgi:hypothetical protein
MKKLLLAALTLGVAVQVLATAAVDISPQASSFLTQNKLPKPDPISDPQVKGLNWMFSPGCAAGNHTVGGVAIKCSGDKTADMRLYIGTVNTTNFYYCTAVAQPNDPFCSAYQ